MNIDRIEAMAKAANTRSAYESDWNQYVSKSNGDYSPEGIKSFLTDLAEQGFKLSTIRRKFAGIRYGFKEVLDIPFNSEEYSKFMSGLARSMADEMPQSVTTTNKQPLLKHELFDIIAEIDTKSFKGIRDRAIILVTWWGAMRVSELVNLRYGQFESIQDGNMVLTLARSKNIKAGDTRKVLLPFKGNDICPVTAVKKLARKGKKTAADYMFKAISRTTNTENNDPMVRKTLQDVFKAHLPHELSSHSCRVGFVSESLARGVPVVDIARQTGHKSLNVLVNHYDQRQVIENNAALRI